MYCLKLLTESDANTEAIIDRLNFEAVKRQLSRNGEVVHALNTKLDIPKTEKNVVDMLKYCVDDTDDKDAALQAATVLVAMASRKKLWRLKLSRRSPIWRPNLLAICLCFFLIICIQS